MRCLFQVLEAVVEFSDKKIKQQKTESIVKVWPFQKYD